MRHGISRVIPRPSLRARCPAQQAGAMRPPRIRGTRPHLKTVPYDRSGSRGSWSAPAHPISHPGWPATARASVTKADFRMPGSPSTPDNGSLTAAKGFHGSTENDELIFSTDQLRRPSRPHAGNYCLCPRWVPMRGAHCYLQCVYEARMPGRRVGTTTRPGRPAPHHSGEPGELISGERRYTAGTMANGLCA